MPFGLCNALNTFQRRMDVVLCVLRWSACLVYLDDIIVFSWVMRKHLDRLVRVLTCLGKAGLKIRSRNCRSAHSELKVLGDVIKAKGCGP